MATVHLIIKGKVQGVYFRATAKEIAQALDVSGWVKNTPEGDVEITASGSEKSIQQLIEWSKKGPDKAVVSSVNVTALPEKSFDDFIIKRG